MNLFKCSFVLYIYTYSGSKLVIEGENLDSAHKTVVQYTPKDPHMQFLQQVS